MKVFNVLGSTNVEVQKFSQGLSKVIVVSLVVNDTEAKHCVQALHSAFFEGADRVLNGSPAQVRVNSPAAPASSGDKRKAVGDHPEAPPGARQQTADTDLDHCLEETEPQLSSDDDPTTTGGDHEGALSDFFDSIYHTNIEPIRVDAGTGPAEEANGIALADIRHRLFSDKAPTHVVGDYGEDPAEEWARLLEQPEQQQVLDEAVEGGGGLRTGTEALLEEFSPDELLGPSTGEMSCPAPPAFEPS